MLLLRCCCWGVVVGVLLLRCCCWGVVVGVRLLMWFCCCWDEVVDVVLLLLWCCFPPKKTPPKAGFFPPKNLKIPPEKHPPPQTPPPLPNHLSPPQSRHLFEDVEVVALVRLELVADVLQEGLHVHLVLLEHCGAERGQA